MNCLLGSGTNFSLSCLEARQAKLINSFPEFLMFPTNVDKLDLPTSKDKITCLNAEVQNMSLDTLP